MASELCSATLKLAGNNAQQTGESAECRLNPYRSAKERRQGIAWLNFLSKMTLDVASGTHRIEGQEMDQLVFVHGVNTRTGPEYEREVARRNQLFKEVVWEFAALEIKNTYWGGSAATFSGGLESLPGRGPKPQPFGFGGALSVPVTQIQPLASVAKVDFGAALDAIFVVMVEQAEAAQRPLTSNEINQFKEAGNYALHNIAPEWAKSQKSRFHICG